MKTTLLLLFSSLVAANPSALIFRRGTPTALPAAGVTGFATFNNYTKQVQAGSGQSTDCGPVDPSTFSKAPFPAAVADLSPDLASAPCTDTTKPSAFPTACTSIVQGATTIGTPTSSPTMYTPPTCKSYVPCGVCFKVTNQGTINGSPSNKGCAYVKVIDSCPHNSAYNYCKIASVPKIPENERCMAANTNAVDIDQYAYQQLTGTPWPSDPSQPNPPNLNILVQNIGCDKIPSGGACTVGGQGATTPPSTSPTTPPQAGGKAKKASKNTKGARGGKSVPVKKASAPKTSNSKKGRYAPQ